MLIYKYIAYGAIAAYTQNILYKRFKYPYGKEISGYPGKGDSVLIGLKMTLDAIKEMLYYIDIQDYIRIDESWGIGAYSIEF